MTYEINWFHSTRSFCRDSGIAIANMEKISNGKRFLLPSVMPACFVLVAGVLFFAGCEKKPVAQTAQPPAKAPAVAQPDLSATLGQLTQVLRKYSFEHRRVPASFGELVAAGKLGPIPAAPPGKKFTIDPKAMQVVLVNQ